MQFVNIIVHSVEDMNFRVHLQYEFTALGLDNYLERLRLTESEELQVQISAYLDNVFDVAALMEDSETKTAALEKVAELEDELGQVAIFSWVLQAFFCGRKFKKQNLLLIFLSLTFLLHFKKIQNINFYPH